ncbi:hypothetical protein ACJMK2_033501 [Sinanodonta woodiana]|uniref:Chitinase n=1 Tax=Sinanodonta woodiana TaxID=1069815 RepID=A0ABD3WSQ7_SINWO
MRRVCYYTNWSQYRNSPGKFYPENVDPNLCTHLIYAFATLTGNQLKAYEWNDESTPWMKGMFDRFHSLKSQNPALKTLLAVGGWNLASAPFTHMAATDASRREFASTAVQFLRKNKFDGLDLDWEYPANRGSPPEDKQKFTQLVQTVHDAFVNEAQSTGGERLLLSAAVGAGKDKIDTAYEIPEISRHLDFINLMTYDLHGSWDDHTGHQSPLYVRSGEAGNDTYLNVHWAAQYWVQRGAPKEKLNIGVSLYGRTFRLSGTDSRVGAAASGAGQAGQYTREAGFLSYYEVCDLLKNGGHKYYITEQKVPYAVKGELWVGYDDQDSLCIKIFSPLLPVFLDSEYVDSVCFAAMYELLNLVRDRDFLANGPPYNPTVYVPQQTTHLPYSATNAPQAMTQIPPAQQATTQKPPVITTIQTHSLIPVGSNEFDCTSRANGYYPSPTSCNQYYICALQQAFRTDCHPGLQFNRITGYCDFADHVTCNNNGGQALPVQTNPGVNWGQHMTIAPPAITNTMAVVTTTSVLTQPPTTAPITLPQTTNAPVTTSTATNLVPAGDFCEHKPDGYYVDPKDCHYFYICNFGTASRTNCPTGTVFNDQLKNCDYPSHTHTCNN